MTHRAERAWRRYIARSQAATSDAERVHAAAEYARSALTCTPHAAPAAVRRVVHELEQLADAAYRGGNPP